MDIRSFFGPKGGNAKGSGPKTDPKLREEEKKKKKRVQVFSDSDSDEELVKKPKEQPKKATSTSSKKEEAVPPKSKLKEVNASDFFNSKPLKTNPVKRKSPEKSVNRCVNFLKIFPSCYNHHKSLTAMGLLRTHWKDPAFLH